MKDFFKVPSVLMDGSIKFIDKKTKKKKILSSVAHMILIYTSSKFIGDGNHKQEITTNEWMELRGIDDVKKAQEELKSGIKELSNTLAIIDGKEINMFDDVSCEGM